MIKGIIYFIISFFLSPEFIVIIIALVLAIFSNIFNEWVIENIKLEGDALKYLAFLPIGLGGWVFSESRKILFPDSKVNKILHEWRGYNELKIVVYVALLYAIIFSSLGLIPWVIGLEVKTFNELLIILTSLTGSIVLATTVYIARINLDEIVERMKKL